MRLHRSHGIIGLLTAGAALAACGGKSSTAPSPSGLAHHFDSAARVDSGTNRGQVEALLALAADEGVRPTTVTVTTGAGDQHFQMEALAVFDTSTTSGLPTDSSSLFVGFSADTSVYLVTEYQVLTGNTQVVSPTPVGTSHEVFLSLRGLLHRAGAAATARTIGTRAAPGVNLFALVVQGHSTVNADSATITATVVPANGSCAWQHVVLSGQLGAGVDSTTACSLVSVTQSFALHFPVVAGIDSSLQHVSMTSTTVEGARLVQ